MKSSDKKAVILTADEFEDMEVLVPLFRLLEAGWQIESRFFVWCML